HVTSQVLTDHPLQHLAIRKVTEADGYTLLALCTRSFNDTIVDTEAASSRFPLVPEGQLYYSTGQLASIDAHPEFLGGCHGLSQSLDTFRKNGVAYKVTPWVVFNLAQWNHLNCWHGSPFPQSS